MSGSSSGMGGFDLGFGTNSDSGRVNQYGNVTQTHTIDKEGMTYLLSQILGGNSEGSGIPGLAETVGAEHVGGLYNSATNSLLTSDELTRAAGFVASQNYTNDQRTDMKTRTDDLKTNSNFSTIICTHLHHLGILSDRLYFGQTTYNAALPRAMIKGYHWWAVSVVIGMQAGRWYSPLLIKAFTPITIRRAEMIVDGKKSFWGYVARYICEPISLMIGRLLEQSTNKEKVYG